MYFYYKYTFCGPKWWFQNSQRQKIMQNSYHFGPPYLLYRLFWVARNSQWQYSWTSAIMSDRLKKYENIAWCRSVPSLFQYLSIPYWRSAIRYEASPNWATTMTQRSEKCFIHGVCLSLKRGLSCFIAHIPSAVIFVLVCAETKQLFSELPVYS